MIHKIKYVWYEGDEGECFVIHPDKTDEEFERDMKQIEDKINTTQQYKEDDLEKYMRVCPSFYNSLIEELSSMGYIIEDPYHDTYYIEDETRHCSENVNKFDNFMFIQKENTKRTWHRI